MLEAHILPHMLAASLAAVQPVAPAPSVPASVSASSVVAPSAASPSIPPPVIASAAITPSPVDPATSPSPTVLTAAPLAEPNFRDPFEPINRVSYRISQPIDRFLIRPVALAYKKVIPHPVRDGARNFIRNLFEPIVFFNDLLQLRPKRALHTVARMALNTLTGLGGVFDVAKRPPFHLVHHENGFGDTLGYYGIGPVAYVYLPVLGPTTLRDMVGELGDAYAEPRLLDKIVHPNSDKPLLRAKLHLGKYSAIAEIVSGLDRRAENDDDLNMIKRTSVDPYASLRSSFLQDRAGEIATLKARDGQAPVNASLDDPLADPAGK